MANTQREYSRGYLPHIHAEKGQTVTLRLHDSLPVSVFNRIKAMADSGEERNKLTERFLDEGRGSCILQRPEAAAIVRDSILWSDGKKYDLRDWVVMPNHAHVSYDKGRKRPTTLVGEIKSFTASKLIDKFDDVEAPVWLPGTFDRYIRDGAHAFNVQRYIWFNPVRAGLVDDPWDWEFSSIHDSVFDKDELRRWFEEHQDGFWSCGF
jgi:REP element-mobilizing transposase RayT